MTAPPRKPTPRGRLAVLLAVIFAAGIVLGDWLGSCAGPMP